MSRGVIAESGYTTFLDAFLGELDAVMRLYVNDEELAAGTVREYLVEAEFDGYAPVGLTNWTPSVLRSGSAFSVADVVRFVWSGVGTPPPIRGCFATAGVDGPLLWAWRRPGDVFTFSPDTLSIGVYVSIQLPAPPGGFLMSFAGEKQEGGKAVSNAR